MSSEPRSAQRNGGQVRSSRVLEAEEESNLLKFVLIKERVTIPGLRGGRTLGKGVAGCVCSRMSL